MMTPTKMKLRVRKKETRAKTSRQLLAETSPDSKCPICLDRFNNVASLDRCLHRFCFRCIHEWSKNKAECPLCKQPFRSIFHSVKAENDFKEFVLAPTQNGPVVAAAAGAATSAGQADAGNPTGRARRSRATRSADRRSGRQQTPPVQPVSPDERLEGLTEATEVLDQEQGVHHMMLRLTERRTSRAEQRNLRRLRDRNVVEFRRALYRTGMRVRSVRDSGRQRDVSAAHLRRNPAYLRRLLPWLQRELMVLYGSHGSLVSIVQHIIMSRITHYDMDDTAIRDELRPFLLARTDHFLHELVSFARSTLSLEAYDQQAVYECPAPSYEEDSRSGSSIIAISEDDDDDSEEADAAVEVTPKEVPTIPLATGGETSLSQSAWDDETPGPSYSTLFPSPSQLQVERAELASAPVQEHEAGRVSGPEGLCANEEEDECMIVGYVKPMAERTPELVQLSSDSSEEEEQEAASTETAAPKEAKLEASSSQLQDPFSPQSYLRPLSPSSCPFPSASHSPFMDGESPPPARTNTSERDTGRHSHRRRKHTQCYGFGRSSCSPTRSRSSSESSALSAHSGSRNRRSGSESKCQESRRQSDRSLRRSPTVSIVSDSSVSSMPSKKQCISEDRSRFRRSKGDRKHALYASSREISSPDSVNWDSSSHNDEENKVKERKRRKKGSDISRSPHGAVSSFHGRRHDSYHCRETHPRSASHTSSSSGEESHAGPPSLEKPAGKRKYKTRHLERAAQRQTGTRSKDGERHSARSPTKKRRGRARALSRSPSVEIIFERRPADTHCRRRRRHKKKCRKEQNSPTVITIDSDSDRTADYQDCITQVARHVSSEFNGCNSDCKDPFTEKTKNTAHSQDNVLEVTDAAAKDQCHVMNAVDAGSKPVGDVTLDLSTSINSALTVPSLDSLLDSFNPVTPPERLSPSPGCTLNLEHCVVDVVDRDSFDGSFKARDRTTKTGRAKRTEKRVSEPTVTPTSDIRLLESILHDLEDILSGDSEDASTRQEVTEMDSGVDHSEVGTASQRDQSEAERETSSPDQTEKSKLPESAESSTAV